MLIYTMAEICHLYNVPIGDAVMVNDFKQLVRAILGVDVEVIQ